MPRGARPWRGKCGQGAAIGEVSARGPPLLNAARQKVLTVVEGLDGATRTDISVTLTIPDVTVDSWVVAIAHGTDGVSSPMFPVVPEDLDPATNQTLEDLTDDNLDEEGVLAYAFTNPLFIDVGNNGWEPPGVTNASCSP